MTAAVFTRRAPAEDATARQVADRFHSCRISEYGIEQQLSRAQPPCPPVEAGGSVFLNRLGSFIDTDHRDNGTSGNSLKRDNTPDRGPAPIASTACGLKRLKTPKRAMYGRAGVELLRARMLPNGSCSDHTVCARPEK